MIYDINRETAIISASLSRNVDKYEFLSDEEILPTHQKGVIES